MKQVAYFKLPEQEAEANVFLAKHPPEAVSANLNSLIVNYDDQTYPDSYKAEELGGLILSNTKQIMTSEIALKSTKHDLDKFTKILAELNSTVITEVDGKQKYDLSKDKDEKVKKYTELVAGLTKSCAELESSIEMYKTRNAVMQGMVSDLNLA